MWGVLANLERIVDPNFILRWSRPNRFRLGKQQIVKVVTLQQKVARVMC